jgi:GNAT superfamily N-acetyltransferase
LVDWEIRYRKATLDDARLLAELNHQLIRDEGHRNPMTVPELETRMRDWLVTTYEAALFEDDTGVVAYALYRRDDGEVYLRQFFVVRERRRRGVGRAAIEILRDQVWPRDKRLLVEVLSHNTPGIHFWKTVGFREYSLALEISPEARNKP